MTEIERLMEDARRTNALFLVFALVALLDIVAIAVLLAVYA